MALSQIEYSRRVDNDVILYYLPVKFQTSLNFSLLAEVSFFCVRQADEYRKRDLPWVETHCVEHAQRLRSDLYFMLCGLTLQEQNLL